MNNTDKLLNIFKRNFDLENEEIDSIEYNKVGTWDSFGQLNLILEVEEEFNVHFDSSEIFTLDSFKQILKRIYEIKSKNDQKD